MELKSLAPRLVTNALFVHFEFFTNIFECSGALHLEMWSIMCNGADENQSHCCDPYGPMVQEQPSIWSAPASLFLLLWYMVHRIEDSNAGADQK